MRVNAISWANTLTFPCFLADIKCHIWTFFLDVNDFLIDVRVFARWAWEKRQLSFGKFHVVALFVPLRGTVFVYKLYQLNSHCVGHYS